MDLAPGCRGKVRGLVHPSFPRARGSETASAAGNPAWPAHSATRSGSRPCTWTACTTTGTGSRWTPSSSLLLSGTWWYAAADHRRPLRLQSADPPRSRRHGHLPGPPCLGLPVGNHPAAAAARRRVAGHTRPRSSGRRRGTWSAGCRLGPCAGRTAGRRARQLALHRLAVFETESPGTWTPPAAGRSPPVSVA